jgi:hypothetical protein
MKFATHILHFNQDNWIFKNIDMVAPYVDKIYVAWSKYPWNYNKKAKKEFLNKSNPDDLFKSKYSDKIILIKGEWDLDEDQRNSCLNRARQDGMDYLLIIDADEFYHEEDLKRMIDNIKKNPDYDYYTTPWMTFWKDHNHLIVDEKNSIINGYPEVCVNLNKNNKFVRCRRPSGNKIFRLDSMCLHASYILSDSECWSKINTWGHAHQFDREKWYNQKWKDWNENTINLHPISPTAWKKAIRRPENIKLPKVLK